MFKQALILATVVATAMAEAPLSGPYPPSGWKPSGAPFTLPKEFIPNPQAGDADIQVSKEQVQFAGQLVETTTVNNAYLPPDQPEEADDDDSTEDILKVQGLPSSERRPFNPRAQSGQLNIGEYNAPSAAERGQYRDQDTQKFGQLRQQNQQQQFVQSKQRTRQFGGSQAEQFGQLNEQPQQFTPQPRQFNQQPQKFNQQPQQFSPQPQQFNQQPQQFNPQPQQFYQQPQQFNPQPQQFNQQPQQFSPQPQQFNQQPQQFNPQPQQFNPQPQQFNQQPQIFSPTPQQFGSQPQVFNVQQPEQFNGQRPGTPATKYGPPTQSPKSDAEDDDDATNASGEDEGTQPNVAVANAISKGQYYILTPDNTLQRVAFTASQDQDEVRTNGFTAQLRYMPVEPIRDPIYAFNDQGQLVRIFKK